jgi:hypothetical protein
MSVTAEPPPRWGWRALSLLPEQPLAALPLRCPYTFSAADRCLAFSLPAACAPAVTGARSSCRRLYVLSRTTSPRAQPVSGAGQPAGACV